MIFILVLLFYYYYVIHIFIDIGIDLFVSGDQLLRGAALNAVLIAEKYLK